MTKINCSIKSNKYILAISGIGHILKYDMNIYHFIWVVVRVGNQFLEYCDVYIWVDKIKFKIVFVI